MRKHVAYRERCAARLPHSADHRETLLRHQLPRGIFINGEEIGWGYEAPKEGIAEAISRTLNRA